MMRRFRIVRGAVAVAHCVQLVVATQDQQQPLTTTRRSSARSRRLRTLGGWAWPCGLRYPLLEQRDAPEASWTAAARRDGVSSCFSIISSESAVQSAVLGGLGRQHYSAPGAARLACWITRRRSVDPLRGHGGAPFGGLVALAPTQQVPTYRVDGRLLGGTGWQVADVRVRISSLCLSCSRARAAWFVLAR